jgi:hypothetical protein
MVGTSDDKAQQSVEDEKVVILTTSERAAIARSREAARRGEFASDEAVQAVWSRHAP